MRKCSRMYFLLSLVVILSIVGCGVGSRDKKRPSTKSLRKQQHPQDTGPVAVKKKILFYYNKDDPPQVDRATDVQIGFYIQDMVPDVNRKSLELNMFFRQLWKDPRLAFNPTEAGATSIRLSSSSTIWLPDIFFKNNRVVRGKSVPAPERLLSINATGHVWYVQSLNGEFTCPLLGEPLVDGVVHCMLYVESYGYKTDTLLMSWLENPVDVDEEIIMKDFSLKNIKKRNCTKKHSSGTFPCLKVVFALEPRRHNVTTT